eukprot:CAMPEP_0115477332 /NCGR_PEP_ID=MMETSP0271-20121206/55616_1 /TAXON_ID=71861 /ORGANISM="Scrippsiella trochoidea, Strain CCMP3099" /LENGTH=43 /DNA_ID= /DNA_START= /DNA_END= /DNA_ORIENTATION=
MMLYNSAWVAQYLLTPSRECANHLRHTKVGMPPALLGHHTCLL